jgi:hypothetical protein
VQDGLDAAVAIERQRRLPALAGRAQEAEFFVLVPTRKRSRGFSAVAK